MLAAVAFLLIVLLVAWQAALLDRAAKRRARLAQNAPSRAELAAVRTATSRTDVVGRLIDALRRYRWIRVGLSSLSVVLALVAAGFLTYPLYTNLVHDRIQSRLNRELASPELATRYREHRVGEGESLTRIKIPGIRVDTVVVEGTGPDALRAGAGHYRSTPLPCENGNVAIAGHRSTYGKPFASMDLVKPGDEIVLETPVGSCRYVVDDVPSGYRALNDASASFVVDPTDVSVVAPTSDAKLTLTTCHPRGSAAKRLIIQATLVSETAAPPVS